MKRKKALPRERMKELTLKLPSKHIQKERYTIVHSWNGSYVKHEFLLVLACV